MIRTILPKTVRARVNFKMPKTSKALPDVQVKAVLPLLFLLSMQQ
jgi:hypothetical protein